MSKNKKITLGVIGGVLVLLIAVAAFYMLRANNPKQVFANWTESIVHEINDALEDDTIDSDQMSYETEIKLNSSVDNAFANYIYNLSMGVDGKNKKANVAFNVSDKNSKKVLDGTMLINDKIYLSVPEIFSKVINLGDASEIWETYATSETTLDVKDITHIIEVAEKGFTNSLNDSDFKVDKNKEITIDGKKVKTTKNTLTIDGKKAVVIAKGVLNEIKNDKKSIKTIASLAEQSEEDIKKTIDQAIKEINAEDFGEEAVLVNFYTAGIKKDVVRIGLGTKDEEYVTIDVKDDIIIKVKSEGTVIATIKFTEFDDDNIVGTFNVAGVVSGNIKMVQTKKEKDSETYNFEFNAKAMNEEFGIIGTMKASTKYNEPSISTSNAVDVNSLSSEDSMEIMSNVENNAFISAIIKEIENLSGSLGLDSSNSDYDYSADYDLDYDFDDSDYDFGF